MIEYKSIFQIIQEMKDRGRGAVVQMNSSSNSAITQPVGEPRNVRRTQQIKALHSQFEDLKKKIKDVQSKNEKIIENIHKQYDFKKKPQTMEYMIEPEPIIYYDKQQARKSQVSGDNQSNPSDNSEYEFKMRGQPANRNSNSGKKQVRPAFHRSIEFKKTENEPEQKEIYNPATSKVSNHSMRPPLPNNQNNQYGSGYGTQSGLKSMHSQQQFQMSQVSGINPFQVSLQMPTYPQNIPNMGMTQVGPVYGQNYPAVNYQFQQTLRRQRQKNKALEQQLGDRESDAASLKKLQKKYSLLSTSYSEIVEGLLEQFMEQVIKKKVYEIDKYVRKNDNKLKRLQLKIKDKEEENRSNRIIMEHRSRRSNSKSRKETSPKQAYYNSVVSAPKIPIMKKTNTQIASPPNVESSSKSKGTDIFKSSQQFSVIANGYEEMIKVKNKEYEVLQQKLKQKDKELTEMAVKYSKLESKMADYGDPNKISKNRVNSQKQQNLLLNQDEEEKQRQVINLNIKISELQNELKIKLNQLRDKDATLQKIKTKNIETELRNKKIQIELNKMREQSKKSSGLDKSVNDLQNSIKKLQSELQVKERECTLLRQKGGKVESEKIERECQNLSLCNKIKKLQNLLKVKQQKIHELQKIIQSSAGGEIGDFLEKSMYLQKFDPKEIHQMQEDKEQLEEQLARQREDIFALKKDNDAHINKFNELKVVTENLKREYETVLIHNESMKINLKAMEFDKYGQVQLKSPLQKLMDEGDCVSQQEENQVREELEQLKSKFEESQRALKNQKQESLECNTRLIKLNSEMSYYKQLQSERDGKYQKLRKEFEENRVQVNQLQAALEQKEEELEVERKVNNEKIKQIESQWLEYEQEMRNKQETSLMESQNPNDLRDSRLSNQSFMNYKTTFNSVSVQNEQLLEKLKEQEKLMEVQREMENKIMEEYRQNIEKIKAELREKNRLNDQLSEEVDSLRRKNRIMEQTEAKLKEMTKQNEEEQLLGAPSQRIMQLELQLAELKEINSKLAAMEQQLFKQVSDKEEEYQNFMRIIHDKNNKIQELQDILELKDMNLSSHITNSQQRPRIRESITSGNSLRYSMLSNNNLPNKTIDMDLSEAGQSFFQNNQSMISNMSEVFARDEFPYEKMHLKRVEQRRLFEKTAAYIKSLKNAIDEKNKRIKLLQKKIDSLRNSELVRKDIYEVKQSFDSNRQEVFKDYLSVQLQNTSSHRYRYKQLEHETKLTIEENNFLNNQIQTLQNDLQKAEDQQTSLMKLKDLYKDEIKALNKRNQELAKTYEDDIKKERQRADQSQAVQKMQAIKQLYLKIMEVIVTLQIEGSKSSKRQQRKRLLQDYVKVFCNLLELQSSVRDKLLGDLIK